MRSRCHVDSTVVVVDSRQARRSVMDKGFRKPSLVQRRKRLQMIRYGRSFIVAVDVQATVLKAEALGPKSQTNCFRHSG